ncbi:MAG: bacillithiol biosynthesis deacetylase BshB1 [Cyclobacteriaceae bacterium]|nr:bacillithiol biosynthesis deacetylase BshB1 [Cyclobacteriaceae bacterium]
MKVDILVFASHPDDAELSCSGTIARHVKMGRKVGIIDLTRGELGTRGTPETREQEAVKASAILGLSVRENLDMPDGFFDLSREFMIAVAGKVRQYQPEIVLANAVHDRHPDHGRAAKLVEEACFYSGLKKISIIAHDGKPLEAWRPKVLYHYIQSNYLDPDFIVDISGYWDIKINSIMAYSSQFFDPQSDEPETFISNPGFLHFIEDRCKVWGHMIGTEFGEGFTVNRRIGVRNLFDLI